MAFTLSKLMRGATSLPAHPEELGKDSNHQGWARPDLCGLTDDELAQLHALLEKATAAEGRKLN